MASIATQASSYPLDAAELTGIARLEAYRLLKDEMREQSRLQPGSLLGIKDIALRLPLDFAMPAKQDPALSRRLSELFGKDAAAYGAAVLDLSDPAHPHYLEHRAKTKMHPASVGKVLVAMGWFQALADRYPKDHAARKRTLRNTQLLANDFILEDTHAVPIWKPGAEMLRSRPLELGDGGNLYTFLDWMLSASSNAAASMLTSELMLFERFGRDYPLSPEAAEAFFRDTAAQELADLYTTVIHEPVTRNGLDLKQLRQGKFFTRNGKSRVPGLGSHATARELMRLLVKMEQGVLVDRFSSLELKRLLYLTDWRTRYAASPALADAAVYYKSGSLYSCQPEEGFECGEYRGNQHNYLTSIAVIESLDAETPLHYLVVITSNVLREDAADAHEQLATQIHALIQELHAPLDPAVDP